ncbi:MAG: spermidine synthase [Planctomycetota bacterium]
MKPRELVATAAVPGHSSELHCYRHDGDFEVWVGHTELMSSRVHGSEEQLVELAFERMGPRKAPRILIGGLGMGFTLARTLQLASERGRVEVAELVPEIVKWNQELFGECAGHPLKDARVELSVVDVREPIAAAENAYDMILLDVDNGPEGLSRPGNDGLYNKPGLKALRRALRHGGVLGVWSAADHAAFDSRIRRDRFQVKTHHVRARRTKGPRRTIWIALAT